MNLRDHRLTLEQSKRLTRARVLGPATSLPVLLADSELAKLVSIILSDTNNLEIDASLPNLPSEAGGDYYEIPLSWFEEDYVVRDLVGTYIQCATTIQNFETYFECLCELHKRRKKYSRILSTQPLPTMLQVSPRALLEFGTIATPALASWLMWRKWFYDIDNRAAQETGYLFEPILANALGGVSYSAQNSPIKRASDKRKGRQVDCLVGSDAYEFKLRVTIAASGQGRFSEELDFAKDSRASNFNPILLVLDPTPSSRLEDLSSEYQKYGGRAYIGDDAWQHLEDESGPIMATFIERYVRRPIKAIDNYAIELLQLCVSSDPHGAVIHFCLKNETYKYNWKIKRGESQFLDNESEEEHS